MGHRNGHGLAANPETGDMWETEQGPSGGDELNILRTGQIQRLVFNDRWEELRREPMLTELKQRIRDIRQGPDGLLAAIVLPRLRHVGKQETHRGGHHRDP